MAQTKTRSSTGRSQKSNTKRKPRSKSKPKAKSGSKTKSPSGSRNGSRSGGVVSKAASKAKLPLVAGSAAAVGAVGGLAVGARQARRHKVIAGAMARRPLVKLHSRDLANAAKEVGSFGAQMGRLASELQQAREGNGKHRSPVEVVLDGLTARRKRS